MVQAIKIQLGFTKSAKKYDLFSGLHRDIADGLISRLIKGPMPRAILDVGCGTGYLTSKLKDHFPVSQVVGLDFAEGMLKIARSKHGDISWVLADGQQMPFAGGSFDSVVSNLAYQWADNLFRVFTEARRVLALQGVFTCTLFGHDTCQELFQSLAEAGAGELNISRLPNSPQIVQALEHSGFKNPEVTREMIKVGFKDMYELLVWLKFIGANNLSRDGYLGRDTMSLAAFIYQAKFPYLNGVGATFEVIQVYAQK